jgi:transcriptional regulator with GAF, ATPase, and Fis domain
MKEFRKNLWDNVFTHDIQLYDNFLWNRMEDFSTLILGETGTGKGTAAMAIGRSGFIPFDSENNCFQESFARSFVSLNLSQFPEGLLESELFGHKKGSFTGAVEDHRGVFENCSPHGAIFLDEIGEISRHVQIKLLKVLQERVFTPVGSHRQARFQGRVIAATNKTIEEIREKKIFRDDFYYRLCSDIITVPTLRERISEDRDELKNLVGITVNRIIGHPSEEYTDLILKVINDQLGGHYHWSGNVRELEQCVRRILLKRTYQKESCVAEKNSEAMLINGLKNGDIDTQTLISGYISILYSKHGTYETVSRITKLDRRTVKKYLLEWEKTIKTK